MTTEEREKLNDFGRRLNKLRLELDVQSNMPRPLYDAMSSMVSELAVIVNAPVVSPPQDTVRARIAVAVSDKGDWNSCGWKNCPNDQESTNMAFEGLDYLGSQVVHFIEADVPLPVNRTVQAEVES
jgi:hypothetical protein